jgi:hypothetical protein
MQVVALERTDTLEQFLADSCAYKQLPREGAGQKLEFADEGEVA